MSPIPSDACVAAVVAWTDREPWLQASIASLVRQTRPLDGIIVAGAPAGADVASLVDAPDVPVVAAPGTVREVLRDAVSVFDAFLLQRGEDWSAPSRLHHLLDAASDADGVGSAFVAHDPSTGRSAIEHSVTADGRIELATALVGADVVRDLVASPMRSTGGVGLGRSLRTISDALCHVRTAGRSLTESITADSPSVSPPAFDGMLELGGSRQDRSVERRARRARRRPPTFVVAAEAAPAETLMWAIAQHPLVLPVVDVRWLVTLGVDAEQSIDAARADVLQQRALAESARVAFEHAVWERATNVVAARRPVTETGWVAVLRSEPAALRAAALLYPDATWVHVVTQPPSAKSMHGRREEWVRRTMAILDAERRLDPERVRRIDESDLVCVPGAAVEAVLAHLDLDADQVCRIVLDARPPAQALASFAVDELDEADALRIAMSAGVPAIDRQRSAWWRLAGGDRGGDGWDTVTDDVSLTTDAKPETGVDLAALRWLLHEHVPTDAVVGVITRGDDRLLDLGVADAWHFPRQRDGRWLGFHPQDGTAALELLDELRGDGAEFLLVPSMYFWWLEFYEELDAALDPRRMVTTDDAALFDLRPYLTDRVTGVPATQLANAELGGPEEASVGERRVAKPLVSVVVTAFNAADHIEASVLSLARQSYRPLEIIVVDDASTDDTPRVLQALRARVPNLRVVRSLQNRGTYFCRNLGIVAARGALLTFNDADDTSHPDRIHCQVARLPSLDARDVVVACDYQRLDADGAVLLNRGVPQRLSLQSLLVPRAVFDEVGYFDTVRMSGDAEFLDRFRTRFSTHNVLRVEEPLYFATTRSDSLTATDGAEARLGETADDAARPVEDFLSEPRRRYLTAYREWHDGKDQAVRVDFPPRARPFPAPVEHTRDTAQPARVVAGMATHLARRDLLVRAILSIAPQVDELHVHLNDYDDPPEGARLSNVTFTTPADHGDLNDVGKFLVLERLGGTEYLMTVDDDIVYPTDYVRRMLVLLEQLGREVAVGVHGAVLAEPLTRFYAGRSVAHFKRGLAHRHLIDVIGTGTMAIHSSVLPVTLDDFRAPGMADLWFATRCKAAGVLRVLIDRPDGWLVPLDSEVSIWSAHAGSDDIQTRVAQAAGPWGRDQLRREAAEWPAALDEEWFWPSLGFASSTEVVLPERTW